MICMIRKMTDCAFQWAHQNNKLRVNAIHQDEEALLILNETFNLVDESGEEIDMSGEFELEVGIPEPMRLTLNPQPQGLNPRVLLNDQYIPEAPKPILHGEAFAM